MFRHGVIHEGIVLVTDNTSSIGNLGDISDSITLVGTTAMPDLIVEHDVFVPTLLYKFSMLLSFASSPNESNSLPDFLNLKPYHT